MISRVRKPVVVVVLPGENASPHVKQVIRMPRAVAIVAMMSSVAAASADPGAMPGWRWSVEGGAVQSSTASLDSGGDVQIDRYYADLGTATRLDDGTRIGLSLGFGESRYDFSGSTGFGGLKPWSRIRQINIGASLFHPMDDHWTIYAIPSLRQSAERGASPDDGRTVGLLAGASYRFSDTLTIGPGFGAFTEIEDDASFFPVLIIDWQITDRLSLGTGQGFAATRGPGLELRWKQSPSWDFAFGGRYEKTRFRLDDKGPASGGVGQDTSLPFYAVANYRVSDDLALSLIGGVDVGTTLTLEDATGTKIGESDADNAGFFGATFKLNL